jgi:hypothetical protein
LITENLSTLQIHKLTQEQYDREFEAGRTDKNAIYLTPDEEINLNNYALRYKSLSDIGLIAPVTTEQICSAMPINSTLIMGVSKSQITDLPENYGTLEITKATTNNYCTAKFSQSTSTTVVAYEGKYATNTSPNWTGWLRVFVRPIASDMFFGHNTDENSHRTIIYGGDGWGTGSSLYLYGKDYQDYEGSFSLRAHDGNTSQYLNGWADGTLTWGNKNLFGEHNKPCGSYTGNGDSSRTVNLGGTGCAIYIYATDLSYEGFITRNGGFGYETYVDGSVVIESTGGYFEDGFLYLHSSKCNQSGKTYKYQVL